MSDSEDTTKNIKTKGEVDPYRTQTDLRALIVDAVREVVNADILPRLTALETRMDRLEQRMDRLEGEVRELRKDFNRLEVKLLRRMTDLEDQMEDHTKPAA
jgi:predicted nuclease with TOPRIM domain